MKHFCFAFLILSTNFLTAQSTQVSKEKFTELAFQALKQAYPNFDFTLVDGKLRSGKNFSIEFDDGKVKSAIEFLEMADVLNMFVYPYPKFNASKGLPKSIPFPEDPGRVRAEALFRFMYGGTKAEVEKKLVNIAWIPKFKGGSFQVTTVNGVDKALKAVSDELELYPELKAFLVNPGGTFNFRVIAGTNRLSVHSFAAAVDINVSKSDYWHDIVTDETAIVVYKNQIPAKIVEIFEKHGFIWGGYWYHFDTMHFEYRPELIIFRDLMEDYKKTSVMP